MAKKTEAKSSEAGEPRLPADTDVLWIVNPAGALHQVTRAHARERFQSAGWRKATPEEIAELQKRGGKQVFDNPIAAPWTPEPAA